MAASRTSPGGGRAAATSAVMDEVRGAGVGRIRTARPTGAASAGRGPGRMATPRRWTVRARPPRGAAAVRTLREVATRCWAYRPEVV